MAERPADSTLPRQADERPSTSRLTGRLVWGIIFLGLGAAWTLDNLGLVDSDAIVRWWPLLLVAFGIAKLTGWGARRSTLAGTLYLVAGGWLILHALDLVQTGIGGLWPLALIVIGGRFVLHAMRPQEPRSDTEPTGGSLDSDGRVKVDVVMATVNRRIRGGHFRGGEVNAVMGSVELDLRDAELAQGKVELEANAVMSGIVVFVPRGWAVVSEVSCVMGAVEDHTDTSAASASHNHTLFLRGAAIMAGIEIKH